MISQPQKVIAFTVCYFSIVLLGISTRLFDNLNHLAFLSRPVIICPLLIFYLLHSKSQHYINRILITVALLLFFVGEITFTKSEAVGFSTFGIFAYAVGKLLYAIYFSNQREFGLKKLIVFFALLFVLVTLMMSLIYNKLGDMVFPVIVYLLATVVVLQFTLMRKNDVDRMSYILVFAGIMLMVFADCFSALKVFYFKKITINQALIIILYAISHYLIVLGVVKEIKKSKEDSVFIP